MVTETSVEDVVLWIPVLLQPVILHKLMNFNTTLAVFLHVTAQQRGFGCPDESISFLAHVQHAYTKLLTAYEKQQHLHGLLLCTLGHSTL